MQLVLPMKTPAGWYVIYQPEYRSPNVFDLNEKGVFTEKPFVTVERGARVLVSESHALAIQYMELQKRITVDEQAKKTFRWANMTGLLPLSDNLLRKKQLEGLSSLLREEIERVYGDWRSSAPKDEDQWEQRMSQAIEAGKKAYTEYLLRKISPWIDPYLPRMVFDFRHGIGRRTGAYLYEIYKEIGGTKEESDLIKAIQIFAKLSDLMGTAKLREQEGWDEDAFWKCACALCGSEQELRKICEAVEKAILPLREELEEEAGVAKVA